MCTTTGMNKGEKKFLLEFMDVYHSLTALWDVESPKYMNKDIKEEQMDVLLEKYRERYPEASRKDISRRIHTLRSNFKRELKRLNSKNHIGLKHEDSTLWYFDALSFLKNVNVPSNGKRKLSAPPTTTTDHKCVELDFLQKAVAHLDNSKKQPVRDDADIFGEGWAAIYRKLDDDQKIYAKRLIDEALMEAQLGHLSYYSSINITNEIEQKHNEIDLFQKASDPLENLNKQPSRDDADIFGEGWAAIYRRLSDDQTIYAKRIIDAALMEAQMGHLSYFSSINLVMA